MLFADCSKFRDDTKRASDLLAIEQVKCGRKTQPSKKQKELQLAAGIDKTKVLTVDDLQKYPEMRRQSNSNCFWAEVLEA